MLTWNRLWLGVLLGAMACRREAGSDVGSSTGGDSVADRVGTSTDSGSGSEEKTEDADVEGSGQGWLSPPEIHVEPPVAAGISGCAPVFVGVDGACRPSAAACAIDELVSPSRGCVVPDEVELPVETPKWVVYADDDVELGLGPGLAEVLEQAPDGATVWLRPGRIRGGVDITRDVILQGAGARRTVIYGDDDVAYVVNAEAGDVTLRDVTIEAARRGIEGSNVATVTIERSLLSGDDPIKWGPREISLRDVRVTSSRRSAIDVGPSKISLERVALPVPTETDSPTISVAGSAVGIIVIEDSIVEGRIVSFSPQSMQVVNSVLGRLGVPCSEVTFETSLVGSIHCPLDGGALKLRQTVAGVVQGASRTTIVDALLGEPNAPSLQPGGSVLLLGITSAQLTRVEIAGSGDVVRLSRPAENAEKVRLTDVRIRHARRSGEWPGVGIRAQDGGGLDLANVVIEGFDSTAIQAFALDLTARDVLIDGTDKVDDSPVSFRFGIVAGGKCTIELERVVLRATRGLGGWFKGGSLVVRDVWVDGVDEGIVVDLSQGVIEGLADGILLADGVTSDLDGLFVCGAKRASLHSYDATGTLKRGAFRDCEYGFLTPSSLEGWALAPIENGCDMPIGSKLELATPTRLRL
ncbi:MAG: hypothetical protein IV100_02980 [Myxococcales bacterium]|nr:hypothetical protein [Myxococcales bacterium]